MPDNANTRDDNTKTATDRERAVGVRETAALLGVAEITLRQRMARNESPRFFRIGRTVRFRLGDVLDYRTGKMVGTPVRP